MSSSSENLEQAVKNLEKIIELLSPVKETTDCLTKFGQTAGKTGDEILKLSGQMEGWLRSITAPSIAVEESIKKLQSVTVSSMGSMEKSLEATKKAAVDWSKSHTDTAVDFIKNATLMATAGLNDKQAIESTRIALTVAKATMSDAGQTTMLLGKLYDGLADKTKNTGTEMAKMGDILVKTQKYYQLNGLEDLGKGLEAVIPSAAKMGSKMEEVNAVLVLLQRSGLSGADAGKAYASVLGKVGKASKDLGVELGKNESGGISLIKTVENIRKKYGDFNAISEQTKESLAKTFGEDGIKAIEIMLGKTDELNKNMKELSNSAGATQKAQQGPSAADQIAIYQNNINALKITLAANLLPAINSIIPPIIKMVQAFGGFAEKHPMLVKIVGGIMAVGAGLTAVFGHVLAVAGVFGQFGGFGIKAIGGIVKGVAKLGPVFKTIGSGAVSAFGGIGKGISALGPIFKTIGSGAVSAFGALARAMIPAIASAWSFTAALLANPITWVVLAIAGLIAIIVLLVKHWDKVKAAFSTGIAHIRKLFDGLPGWLKTVIDIALAVLFPIIGIPMLIIKNWDKIKTAFSTGMGQIRKLFDGMPGWLKSTIDIVLAVIAPLVGIPRLIIKNWDKIKTALRDFGKFAKEWGKNLMEMLAKSILNFDLGKTVHSVANKIKKYLGFHSPAEEGPCSDADKWAPNFMNMYESGINKGLPKLKKAALTVAMGVSLAMAQPAVPAMAAGMKPATPSTQPIHRQIQNETADRTVHIHFEGPVTIQANNPEDLWSQLKRFAEEAG